VSPKEKHVPDDAERTSVCLTAEDRGAIYWIKEARKSRESNRTTVNDILVDALWYFLEKSEGREQIRAALPPRPKKELQAENKVTQMPPPKKKL
jgi:hypothetical protein